MMMMMMAAEAEAELCDDVWSELPDVWIGLEWLTTSDAVSPIDLFEFLVDSLPDSIRILPHDFDQAIQKAISKHKKDHKQRRQLQLQLQLQGSDAATAPTATGTGTSTGAGTSSVASTDAAATDGDAPGPAPVPVPIESSIGRSQSAMSALASTTSPELPSPLRHPNSPFRSASVSHQHKYQYQYQHQHQHQHHHDNHHQQPHDNRNTAIPIQPSFSDSRLFPPVILSRAECLSIYSFLLNKWRSRRLNLFVTSTYQPSAAIVFLLQLAFWIFLPIIAIWGYFYSNQQQQTEQQQQQHQQYHQHHHHQYQHHSQHHNGANSKDGRQISQNDENANERKENLAMKSGEFPGLEKPRSFVIKLVNGEAESVVREEMQRDTANTDRLNSNEDKNEMRVDPLASPSTAADLSLLSPFSHPAPISIQVLSPSHSDSGAHSAIHSNETDTDIPTATESEGRTGRIQRDDEIAYNLMLHEAVTTAGDRDTEPDEQQEQLQRKKPTIRKDGDHPPLEQKIPVPNLPSPSQHGPVATNLYPVPINQKERKSNYRNQNIASYSSTPLSTSPPVTPPVLSSLYFGKTNHSEPVVEMKNNSNSVLQSLSQKQPVLNETGSTSASDDHYRANTTMNSSSSSSSSSSGESENESESESESSDDEKRESESEAEALVSRLLQEEDAARLPLQKRLVAVPPVTGSEKGQENDRKRERGADKGKSGWSRRLVQIDRHSKRSRSHDVPDHPIHSSGFNSFLKFPDSIAAREAESDSSAASATAAASESTPLLPPQNATVSSASRGPLSVLARLPSLMISIPGFCVIWSDVRRLVSFASWNYRKQLAARGRTPLLLYSAALISFILILEYPMPSVSSNETVPFQLAILLFLVMDSLREAFLSTDDRKKRAFIQKFSYRLQRTFFANNRSHIHTIQPHPNNIQLRNPETNLLKISLFLTNCDRTWKEKMTRRAAAAAAVASWRRSLEPLFLPMVSSAQLSAPHFVHFFNS